MMILLTIIHIIVCLVLVAVILLQAGRGQGLSSSSFGGGNVQSIFGTRAADFLTKATSAAAICFLLTSIGLNIFEARNSRSLLEGSRRGQKAGTPIDLARLKEALEKAKAEAEKSGKTKQGAVAGSTAAGVAQDVAGQAQAAAAQATQKVGQAAEVENAPAVPNTPVAVAPEDKK